MSEAVPTGQAPPKPGRKGRRRSTAKATPKATRPATPRAIRRTKRKAKDPAATGDPFRKQLGTLLRAAHLRQAVLMAAAIFVLALVSDRTFPAALVAAVAVLVVQMALGLGNDLADIERDRAAGTEGKPLATGDVPRGNVTYAILVLLILAVPLALQSGWPAGTALLATVLIGGVHNKWLHNGAFSWVGWVLTFALLPAFLAYGSWPGDPHGPPPTWSFTLLGGALGLCLHFATALPDLVQDHAAGRRTLPLRVALKTGAPRLLVITGVASALVGAGLLVAGLTVGIRQ